MTSRYIVYVKTGDQRGAGTDANIHIILHGENSTKTEALELDNFLRNDFERGRTDKFTIPKGKTEAIGTRVKKVEFWRDDSGIGSDWYVDLVTVENVLTKEVFEFPVLRWIDSDYHYVINHLDTSLPQHDEHKDQRLKELNKKQEAYIYAQKAAGMPAQVSHPVRSSESRYVCIQKSQSD